MNLKPIFINDVSIVAPIDQQGWSSEQHAIQLIDGQLVAPIISTLNKKTTELRQENKHYASLDRSVLLAILACRSLELASGHVGINIGSSRGATAVWEDSFTRFRESGTTPTQTSPLTTLGNLSTWVAQDLGINATAISHSITCATASHAILNAIAWLNSGMADQFIAGGSEAPLTAFTIAQMHALRIYSNSNDNYPCRALDLTKSNNTMILGEAAACMVLSKKQTANTYAQITGYGTAIESLDSATSISSTGNCIKAAMRTAIKHIDPNEVDVIITHAPGTIKGDQAEFNAIKSVFGDQHPILCNNKWQIGHTLGASSALSIVMAVQMIKQAAVFNIPYIDPSITNPKNSNKPPQTILVNAVGFGGNAVSLLIEKTHNITK